MRIYVKILEKWNEIKDMDEDEIFDLEDYTMAVCDNPDKMFEMLEYVFKTTAPESAERYIKKCTEGFRQQYCIKKKKDYRLTDFSKVHVEDIDVEDLLTKLNNMITSDFHIDGGITLTTNESIIDERTVVF